MPAPDSPRGLSRTLGVEDLGALRGAVPFRGLTLLAVEDSRYASEVEKALANTRTASKRMAQIEAAQSARARLPACPSSASAVHRYC